MKTHVAVALLVVFVHASTSTADTIYGTGQDRIIWQINTTAVTATAVAPANAGPAQYEDIAIKPGTTNGVVGEFGPNLFPVNVATGVVGSSLGAFAAEYQALAYAPNNQLWGFDDLSGPDQLVMINDTNGTKTNVGARSQRVNAMAFVGSTAYAWAETPGLMTVDLSTGVLTDVNAGVGGTPFMLGMTLGPNDGILYGTDGSNLYTINIGTGAATLLGVLSGPSGLQGLASVTVTADAVPEPSSMLLSIVSGATLALVVWRRRRGSAN